jgi:hypothetical protein
MEEVIYWTRYTLSLLIQLTFLDSLLPPHKNKNKKNKDSMEEVILVGALKNEIN